MFKTDYRSALPPESLYIYSLWQGYLDGAGLISMRAALDACGAAFRQRHTSGHAPVADLIEFARAIAPRVVIPIHTDAPERFAEVIPHARLLADGVRADIAEL